MCAFLFLFDCVSCRSVCHILISILYLLQFLYLIEQVHKKGWRFCCINLPTSPVQIVDLQIQNGCKCGYGFFCLPSIYFYFYKLLFLDSNFPFEFKNISKYFTFNMESISQCGWWKFTKVHYLVGPIHKWIEGKCMMSDGIYW